MRSDEHECHGCCLDRRDFLLSMGTAAGTAALLARGAITFAQADGAARPKRQPAPVRGAFLYPPSQTLREAGYYSWPGSSFDAEGHQKRYAAEIDKIQKRLGMSIAMDATPLDDEAERHAVHRGREGVAAGRAAADSLQEGPLDADAADHRRDEAADRRARHARRVVDRTTSGTVHRRPGVYLISAMDDFAAVEQGMRMLRTAHRMRESLLVNLAGDAARRGRGASSGHAGADRAAGAVLRRLQGDRDDRRGPQARGVLPQGSEGMRRADRGRRGRRGPGVLSR